MGESQMNSPILTKEELFEIIKKRHEYCDIQVVHTNYSWVRSPFLHTYNQCSLRKSL